MSAARVAVLLGLIAPLLICAPVRAETTTVVSVGFQFAPADAEIAVGDSLKLLNVDVAPHNIVSLVSRRGVLLFASATVSAGQEAPVRGVEKLTPGAYGFYCSVHPQMVGSLLVKGAGGAQVAVLPTGGVVPTPTSLTTYDGALYVASYARGTVERLPILPGGALAPATTYASGFTNPLGVAFGPEGTMFVSDSHSLGTATVGRVQAVPPGGGNVATVGRIVVDDLPNGRHNTNGLAVHAARLYIANGNSTDDGVRGGPPEQPLSGTVISVPVGATGISATRPRTALQVEASGLRNPYDIAFRPGTSELWVANNGPDALDPYGEDSLHRFDVRGRTVDFGFPACVYRSGPVGPEVGQNPSISTPCNPRHTRPEMLMGLHVSANGIAFAPTSGGWAGELLVAEYGSNVPPPAGHAVVRVPIVGGRASAPERLAPAGTPLDVTFGPSGAGAYVVDFATGLITLLNPVG